MMSIQDIVKLTDELIFSHTGQHLNDLQEKILLGTLEGKDYAKIASETQYSEKYVRDSAGKLWKKLSEVVGKKVTKINVKTTIERATNIQNSGIQINHNNLCRDSTPARLSVTEDPVYIENLNDAPLLDERFYGRTQELKLLQDAIINNKINLVTILGLRGIGKTALSLQLIERIKQQFDRVIYKNLKTLPDLTQLIKEILEYPSIPDQNHSSIDHKNKLARFKTALQNHRFLIVLDDVNLIFRPLKLMGQYEEGYEEYGTLFKLLTETKHQGCVIINTCEIIREFKNCFSLHLSGLNQELYELFKSYHLTPETDYQKLKEIYEGNPAYLKLISELIQDLFSSSITDFFSCEQLLIDNELTEILRETFSRLSESEMKLMQMIANQNYRISLNQLKIQAALFSPTELVNTVQSLKKRLLLNLSSHNEQTLLEISPIIKKYLKN